VEKKGSYPPIKINSNYPQNNPKLLQVVLPGVIHRLFKGVDNLFLPVNKIVDKQVNKVRIILFGG
jgi:hypothetical protein